LLDIIDGTIKFRSGGKFLGHTGCFRRKCLFCEGMITVIWEHNIKINLQEVGCGGTDWIDLAQDRDRWWALVNAVMSLRVP
jgi:hypothetical protein